MKVALDETNRRREKQQAYNIEHNITPRTTTKAVFAEVGDKDDATKTKDRGLKFVYNKNGVMDAADLRKEIASLTKKMRQHAENLEFEEAGALRDQIRTLQDDLLLVE
jgi:excinuclease ABC subunit B